MGNLLFSPSGRINAAQFMQGAYVLIALGFVINVFPLISFQIGSILSIVGLALIWCWIALFIKRFHDAGKSGWLCLVPIVIFIIGSMVLGSVLSNMFAGDLVAEMETAVEAATEAGSFADIMKITMEMGVEISKKTALPVSIATAALSFIVAYAVNMKLKGDEGDNQFGPAT